MSIVPNTPQSVPRQLPASPAATPVSVVVEGHRPGALRRFLDFLRSAVGRKPLDQALRAGEAAVTSLEVRNTETLMKAEGRYQRDLAEAAVLQSQARRIDAATRLVESAATSGDPDLAAAYVRLLEAMKQLEAHGGRLMLPKEEERGG